MGRRRGLDRRLLAGGTIRVTEIHSERNPYFGGVNPEPIPPNIDEALGILAGGGYDLGLLLDGDADRAGAADEQGTFIHQLEVIGLLMYYLVEHRGMREPVVVERQRHVDGRPPGRALRRPDVRDVGRLQVRRPQDDRDGRHDGRRGVGRLRLRHAPARARRRLRRPAAAGPVPPRAGGRALAGVGGAGPPPRHRGTVVLPAHRRARRRAMRIRRSRTGCWSSSASRRPRRSPATPSCGRTRCPPTTASSSCTADGSWLLVRFSGTEPLVRVYAEATTPDQRDALLKAGERLVREA